MCKNSSFENCGLSHQDNVLHTDVLGLRVRADVLDELHDLQFELLLSDQEVADGGCALQAVVAEIPWPTWNCGEIIFQRVPILPNSIGCGIIIVYTVSIRPNDVY